MKSVFKEICIMLLLCIAVILIFAIVFYDYIQVYKVVQNKVSYTVPEDVKAELEEDVYEVETKPQEITYSVTESDLKNYQSSTVYQPGNPNPFKFLQSGSDSVDTSTGTATGNSGTGTDSNKIQYYYPATSTK